MLRPVLTVLLALVIAITGFQAAAARAAPMAAGVMELCLGTAVVTVLVDADGQPVERHHVCPDGVFALFGAEAGGMTDRAPRRVWTRIAPVRAGVRVAGRAAPAAQARGPPVTL